MTSEGIWVQYEYDPLGRRVERRVVEAGIPPAITRYYYDGWQAIEERELGESQGEPVEIVRATYVYSDVVDDIVSMRRPSGGAYPAGDYFFHQDDQGNVLLVTDASGAVVERYEYDDFGTPTIIDPATGQPRATSAIGNRFLFTGREWDPDTKLYHYRFRDYDPATGRFLQRDPIGVWGDLANLGNGTAYVGNNPWSAVDPYGLEGCGGISDSNLSVAQALNSLGPGTLRAIYFHPNLDPTANQALFDLLNEDDASLLDEKIRRIEQIDDYNRVIENVHLAGVIANEVAKAALMQVGIGLAAPALGAGVEIAAERMASASVEAVNASRAMRTGQVICQYTQQGLRFAKVGEQAAKGTETFYRTMSEAHYAQLLATGKIPASAETFISPSLEYVRKLRGVTVKFTVRAGTEGSLMRIGVRHNGLREAMYSHLPVGKPGWTSGQAFFKFEKTVVNIGLGRGTALETFNANILYYNKVP